MEGKFLTISDAAILAKKLSILRFDVDDSWYTLHWHRLEGFSVDPTAAIEAYTKRRLFIYQKRFKVGLELDDTANHLKNHIPNIENIHQEPITHVLKQSARLKKDTINKSMYKMERLPVEDGLFFAIFLLLFMCILTPSVALVRAALIITKRCKRRPYSNTEDSNNHYADVLRYDRAVTRKDPEIRVRRLQ